VTDREVHPGQPFPRGASYDGTGVNFALYSRVATRVEVCIFNPAEPSREIDRFDLPETTDFVWHDLPRPRARVSTLPRHGPYERKVTAAIRTSLIDPYAKALRDVD
jgi:glycogen operon protein